MKTLFKYIVIVSILFTSRTIVAQGLQEKGIQSLYVISGTGEYTVGENGDSIFARYLQIEYINDPAGAKFTVLLQNATDTNAVVQLTNMQFTVPGSDAANEGLYSIDRTGNTIRVFLGNLSLLSRSRIKVWIESDEQTSYATDF